MQTLRKEQIEQAVSQAHILSKSLEREAFAASKIHYESSKNVALENDLQSFGLTALSAHESQKNMS